MAQKGIQKEKNNRPLPDFLQDVTYVNQIANSLYKPQPFPDKVTLFLGQDEARSRRLDIFYRSWKQLALAGIEVHNIPEDHRTIIQEPQVAILAEKLMMCLDDYSNNP